MEYLNTPFDIKEVDIKEDGTFSGYGSLFDKTPDANNDLVAPGAFMDSLAKGGRNRNGIPMLWQHQRDQIPGVWKELTEDKRGLSATGRLALNSTLGNDVYQIMRLGAETGTFKLNMSIGYDPIEYEEDKKKKIRTLKKVELWELSLVTFPAKVGASVRTVKSLEAAKTPRELENALRDAGLSGSMAKYLVSLCKQSLWEAVDEKTPARDDSFNILAGIIDSIASVNNEMETAFETKRVIPYRKYPLADENEAWDGPAQIRESEVEDLRIICAWYDAENSDIKSAYKLPHHKVRGYTTVWRGVAAAMARLLQAGTKIPSGDRRGVYNHLAKHYKDFDKTVPEFRDYSEYEWKSLFWRESFEIYLNG